MVSTQDIEKTHLVSLLEAFREMFEDFSCVSEFSFICVTLAFRWEGHRMILIFGVFFVFLHARGFYNSGLESKAK